MTDPPLVLILGAGINGAAVARELVLNGVGVCLVDKADIATGATSRSSRLIHGGLRYLEYADFALVSESLKERARLLKNAPQFVRPLKLHIPVSRRSGGFAAAGLRFVGAGARKTGRWILNRLSHGRGLWTVNVGLLFYDLLSGRDGLPKHSTQRVEPSRAPRVDPQKFQWVCSYWDGQIEYPERFVLAMLSDAQQHAAHHKIPFSVHTYHEARFDGTQAAIVSASQTAGTAAHSTSAPTLAFEPLLIVNATGAWGDQTLDALHVASPRLFGGTKGSHFFTPHRPLREAIGDDGIYAEAADGRLVFILPVTGGTWVGTTDERYEGDPGDARASEREIEYLIGLVNEVLDGVELNRSHVVMHCAGVRPLPYVPVGSAAAIPRGHAIAVNESGPRPVLTLIGGKLTTCRALGEEVGRAVIERLGTPFSEITRDRPLPGATATTAAPGRRPPASDQGGASQPVSPSLPAGLSEAQYLAVRALAGDRWDEMFPDPAAEPRENLHGTQLPLDFVRWVIEHEWVTHVCDLVERRLMLLYQPELSRACLEQLANCLVQQGRISEAETAAEVEHALTRLRELYGRELGAGLSSASQ